MDSDAEGSTSTNCTTTLKYLDGDLDLFNDPDINREGVQLVVIIPNLRFRIERWEQMFYKS